MLPAGRVSCGLQQGAVLGWRRGVIVSALSLEPDRLFEPDGDVATRDEGAGSASAGDPAAGELSPRAIALIPLIVPLAAVTLLVGGLVILSNV